MKKTIGFVDYYLSEWHANHYPEWIREANQTLGTDYQVAYAWAEENVSPLDGITTDQWCETFGVKRCETIEELCEKCDHVIVLAPSDPQKHLQYAAKVLPFGKRCYIDKTFAPDYSTAKAIFDIAAKHGTDFFSSSALRYASELKEIGAFKTILLTGGGSNFNEYCIHLVEMAVSLMKDPVKKVKVDCVGKQRLCRLVSKTGLEAALVYSPGFGYQFVAEQAETGKFCKQAITSAFFQDLMCDIIRFFESGKASFDPAETLEVMRVRDALLTAEQKEGSWLSLEEAK